MKKTFISASGIRKLDKIMEQKRYSKNFPKQTKDIIYTLKYYLHTE